ncbi:hypothetical protein LEMLEM_LOCUS15649 [Lemmus lemmus]
MSPGLEGRGWLCKLPERLMAYGRPWNPEVPAFGVARLFANVLGKGNDNTLHFWCAGALFASYQQGQTVQAMPCLQVSVVVIKRDTTKQGLLAANPCYTCTCQEGSIRSLHTSLATKANLGYNKILSGLKS